MDFKIMKKIVFGLLMTMGMLNAQNNLVFNQVLNFNITTSDTATVPEGKVWKIERAQETIIADKQDVNYGAGSIGGYYYGTDNNNALWFSEGTTIRSNANFMSLSILEFDVVPTSTGTGSGTGGGGVSSDGLVFEEAMSITLTRTQVLNSNASLFGEITIPEGKILKIFNVSTYALLSSGDTQSEGNGMIYIGDELFSPSLNNNIALIRFIPSGTYTVKLDWGTSSVPNRIVVNALLYSIP